MKKTTKTTAEWDKKELLQEYTQWLLDHWYCDNDVWCEEPTAVERFLSGEK